MNDTEISSSDGNITKIGTPSKGILVEGSKAPEHKISGLDTSTKEGNTIKKNQTTKLEEKPAINNSTQLDTLRAYPMAKEEISKVICNKNKEYKENI